MPCAAPRTPSKGIDMNDAAARNFEYLAYGLIAVWAILVVYVLTLVSRERRISRQMESLQRMLEDKGAK
jgi:CcmD family protein